MCLRLMDAATRTRFARCPNLRVLSISSPPATRGDTQMTRSVFAFPPKLDESRCVNFELRYGTWVDFLEDDNALIQFPSAAND